MKAAIKSQVATTKQFRAVVYKFAKQIQVLRAIEDCYWFRLWKQVEAVLARHNPKGVTRDQVSEWFKSDNLPDYLIGNLQLHELVKQPKVAKKQPKVVKKQPKVAKEQPKVVKEQPKVVKDFDSRLTFLEGQVSEMSESIETIKSGMEMILESIRR